MRDEMLDDRQIVGQRDDRRAVPSQVRRCQANRAALLRLDRLRTSP
jgi:hypothetical protein